jgi:hypothetical protein
MDSLCGAVAMHLVHVTSYTIIELRMFANQKTVT